MVLFLECDAKSQCGSSDVNSSGNELLPSLKGGKGLTISS